MFVGRWCPAGNDCGRGRGSGIADFSESWSAASGSWEIRARLTVMRQAVAAANQRVCHGRLIRWWRLVCSITGRRPYAIFWQASRPRFVATLRKFCPGRRCRRRRGVDSTAGSDVAQSAAEQLARSTGAVVAVTGETDFITDGNSTWATPWGHPIMTRVVGTGCALSALVAAFLLRRRQIA